MSKSRVPNVFIKEIDIFDSNYNTIGINVTTIAYDVKDKKNSWSLSPTAEQMKILLVVSTSPFLNDDLQSGRMKMDVNALKSLYGSDNSVFMQTRLAKSKKMIETEGEYKFLDTHTVHLSNTNSLQDIKVFCCAYFEMEELLQSLNLNSSGDFRRLGSVSCENIFTDGSVERNSTVFVLPDGSQYKGPVHYHPDKGFMVGPKHTSQSHAALRTLTVPNYKIKDFRKHNYTPPNTDKDTSFGPYSDLKYSINAHGIASATFCIDFKSVILNNTKYGYFLKSLSDEAIEENLINLKIKNLQITRKRVDVDETRIIIKSYTSIGSSNIQAMQNDEASLSEIDMGRNDIRHFQFTDKTLDKTSLGLYEYHISLSFVDPTIQFISNLESDYAAAIRDFANYYIMTDKPKNYDFEMNRTRERLYQSQFVNLQGAGAPPPSWTRANEIYTRVMSYLYELTNMEKLKLTHSVLTKVDPKNATIYSLRSFNEDLVGLYNSFLRLLRISNSDPVKSFEKTFVKEAKTKNVIFLEHIFKEKVVFKNYAVSYNYLNLTSDIEGVPTLTSENILNRFQAEKNKFFIRNPTPSDYPDLPDRVLPIFDLQSAMYTYLSPISISFGDERVNLNDIELVKIQNINKLFNRKFDYNIYNLGTTFEDETVSDDMAGNESVGSESYSDFVEPANDEINLTQTSTDSEIEPFLTSADYLGEGSLFVNYDFFSVTDENEIFNAASTDISEETAAIFDVEPEINFSSDMTEGYYNILRMDNFLLLMQERHNRMTTEEVNNFVTTIPNQIRALLTYLYPFTKKMPGPTIQNVIGNLAMQASVNVNYLKLVRFEILDGYETTSGGKIMLHKSKFRPLTKQDIDSLTGMNLCRIKKYYDNRLKLRRDILSFPIENQYFFIQKTNSVQPTKRVQPSMVEFDKITTQHLLTRNYDSIGTTSNIVTQNGAVHYNRPNDASGGITAGSNTTGFNEAVGNINRLSTTGGGMTGGGGSTGGGGY